MSASSKDFDASRAHRLRLSLTGECGLKCFYCKSFGKDDDFVEAPTPIAPSDVSKLVRVLGELGITEVWLDGADPLLRKDAPQFVKAAMAHKGIQDVRLITNGMHLKAHADQLRKMGLRKVDINLDTLQFARFQRLMGKDGLYRVLDGIEKVEKLNFQNIRLNVFLLKDVNTDEIVEFARMTRERNLHVRFMEYDPIRPEHNIYGDRLYMSVLEAKRVIDNYQGLQRIHNFDDPFQIPAFRFPEGTGQISFLSRVELARERAVQTVTFDAIGRIGHNAKKSKPVSIVEQLRKDPKCLKFHRQLEKILTVAPSKSSSKKAPKKAPSKTTSTTKRSKGARNSSAASATA